MERAREGGHVITRHMLESITQLLRPVVQRASNTVARAVVKLVDDRTKLQLLQLGALEGETIDAAEHHQAFGFSSVPMPGAEAVVVFPGGDRDHPLVVAVSDRRYRPHGGDPGTITIYNHTGARVIITDDGDIEVIPASGREVLIRDEGGSAERLVRKSDYDGHTHPAGTLVAPSGGGPVSGVSGGAAAAAGTQRLRAQ